MQLKRRQERFEQGRETIDFLLQAQRNWSDALRDESVAVCNYNVALADYERQKGTITQYRNVTVLEGPPPACAAPEASKRIRLSVRSCPAVKVGDLEGTRNRFGLVDVRRDAPPPWLTRGRSSVSSVSGRPSR